MNSTDPNIADPLFCMTCLQLSLSQGFTKRMKEHLFKTGGSNSTNNAANTTNTITLPSSTQQRQQQQVPILSSTLIPQYAATTAQPSPSSHAPPPPLPFMETFQFNSLTFDNIALPDTEQQASSDNWLWDMVMDDFSMPPL